MAKRKTATSTAKQLAFYFDRNGYVRLADLDRRKEEKQKYKKGDEVRLVAQSDAELATIRRLLHQAGFKVSNAFTKGRQFRQPVYGRLEVARFLALVGAPPDNRVQP